MVAINLSLTKTQINRLDKGLSVRLSAAQLDSGDHELDISPDMAKRIETARRRGKGCIVSGIEVDGGSLRSIRNSFKRAGKKINQTFTKFGNDVANKAPGELTKIGHHIGDGVEQGKKYVPKAALSKLATVGIMAGSTMIGQPHLGLAANAVVQSGLDATYSTNLSKGSIGKNFGKNFGKALANNSINAGVGALLAPGAKPAAPAEAPTTGAGLKRPKLVKGSQEARDYMASIRKKKGTTGAGFGPIKGEGFAPIRGGSVAVKHSKVLDAVADIERRATKHQYYSYANVDKMGGNFIPKQPAFVGRGFMPI